MNRRKSIGIALLIFVTGVTLMMGSATAQQNETEVNTTNYEVKNETVIMAIDQNLDLVDYEFRESSVIVVVESKRPVKQIRLTGESPDTQGVSRLPDKQVMLQEGRNVISMQLNKRADKSVTISTTESSIEIEGKQDNVLSNLFERTFSGWALAGASIASGIVSVTVVLIAAYKREESIASNVERKL